MLLILVVLKSCIDIFNFLVPPILKKHVAMEEGKVKFLALELQ